MRPSQRQIDRDIVDLAASLFARQGYDRTSVQQIADAAGYSKTGLLHRFPSKQALLDAVHHVIRTEVDRLIDAVEALPESADRMTVALHQVAEAALAHPGPVLLLLNTVDRDETEFETHAWIEHVVHRLFGAVLGTDLIGEPALRLKLAMQLICSGAVLGCLEENSALRSRLPGLLVDMATDVVGRPHPAVPPRSPEGTR